VKVAPRKVDSCLGVAAASAIPRTPGGPALANAAAHLSRRERGDSARRGSPPVWDPERQAEGAGNRRHARSSLTQYVDGVLRPQLVQGDHVVVHPQLSRRLVEELRERPEIVT
jgi:hypothetical protein